MQNGVSTVTIVAAHAITFSKTVTCASMFVVDRDQRCLPPPPPNPPYVIR